eukprot:TRINITY_DN64_c0_g1_i4.p1 TRINITY_DN64_c0_g1~~TRINITY_DN64_c0_g1_i4.p1  ORF type:complete len:706 (+),score=151.92 TRINITY_DN64_c0_g1_i4:257-2119(+)
MDRLTEERTFYHWDRLKNCIRWGVQGMMDPGEMGWYTRPEGDKGMVSGGGFYMSSNAVSSSNYGPCLTRILIQPGTLLYTDSKARKALGFRPSNRQKVYIGQIIPFAHNYRKDSSVGEWWVTHHHDVVTTLKVHGDIGAGVKTHIQWNRALKQIETLEKLVYYDLDDNFLNGLRGGGHDNSRANAFRNSIGYLKSFWSLLTYRDVFSFIRACLVRPDDPWQEIGDLHHFGGYHNTLLKKAKEALGEPGSLHIAKSSVWGDGGNCDTWAESVRDEILPQLFTDIIGSANKGFRDYPAHVGPENFKVHSTKTQFDAMSANPYFMVEGAEAADDFPGLEKDRSGKKRDWLVDMWYPDVSHAQKALDGTKVPQDLASKIEGRTDWNSLVRWGDLGPYFEGGEARTLTRELMGALVLDWAKSICGKPLYSRSRSSSTTGVAGPLGIDAIHPLGDADKRISRMFGLLGALDSKFTDKVSYLAYTPIGDIGLRMTPARYTQLLQKTAELVNQFKRDMFERMMKWVMTQGSEAKWENAYNDMPSFYKMTEVLNFFHPKSRGTYKLPSTKDEWSRDLLDLIHQRDWVKFMDAIAEWSAAHGGSGVHKSWVAQANACACVLRRMESYSLP